MLIFVHKLLIYWIGKIDVAQRDHEGRLMMVDHKTSSRLGSTFWDKFQISSQMLGYCWAARHFFNEEPKGVIINVVALRKPTRTGTSVEFHRQPYYYTTEQIDDWKEETLTAIADFVSSAIRGIFPPAKCNCIRVYGKCPYFEVCVLPKAQRKFMLHSSQFVNTTWDPTKEN